MGKLYVRVDDRLIHGQTIVAWCPTLGIQEIVAVDDVSAANPMLKSILTMGVPKNYKTSIVTAQEARELLCDGSEKTRLLIVKFPQKLEELRQQIAGCEKLILGNLAKRPDTNFLSQRQRCGDPGQPGAERNRCGIPPAPHLRENSLEGLHGNPVITLAARNLYPGCRQTN